MPHLLLTLAACTAPEVSPLPVAPAVPFLEDRLERPGLQLYVDGDGTHVRRPGGDVVLRTATLDGIAVYPGPAAEGPCLVGSAGCVRPLTRQADGLQEWWIGRERGAQQLWWVDERPGDELILGLEVQGATAIAAGDVAVLRPAIGASLHYRDLRAFDAHGAPLPARFEAGEGLSIHVDVRGAAWPVLVDPLLTSDSLILHRPAGAGPAFGTSVAQGDLNGDGREDLAIGDPGDANNPGRVLLYPGQAGGTFLGAPSQVISAPSAFNCRNNKAGTSVDLGDLNNDGRADLIAVVLPASCSATGAVFVHLGTAAGLSAAPIVIPTTASPGAARSVGDVNGDGFGDLAFLDNGQIKVVHGAINGPGTSPNRTLTAPSPPFVSLSGAGRVNNDRFDDLITGANGGVWLYGGSGAGIGANPAQALTAPAGSVAFGWAVDGAGDVNDDGRADVIVGDPGFSGADGRAWLYPAAGAGLAASGVMLDTRSPGQREGITVSDAGDVNGDGHGDVIVLGQGGRANGLWEGQAGGIATTPRTREFPGSTGVDPAGDVDDDGFADVVIGAASESRVYVLFGCADADGDGLCARDGDCDDTRADVGPGASELVASGVDEDCDGQELCLADADDDGHLSASGAQVGSADLDCDDPFEGLPSDPLDDCDDRDAARHPGAAELAGDGVDGDCDGGERCLADADDDGFLVPEPAELASVDVACDGPGEGAAGDPRTDCDDAAAAVRPGAAESPGDGVDQDCDGAESCLHDADDDGFVDGSGAVIGSTDSDCDDPHEALTTAPGSDCDDADPTRSPAAAELRADGVDQDCDGGELCLRDGDSDGFLAGRVSVVSIDADCADPGEALLAAPLGDCDDGSAAVHPGAEELPGSEVDEDCDGGELCLHDDDDDGFLDPSGDVLASADPDCDDPHEAAATAPTTDCDDADPARSPVAAEVRADGVDQDCDGGEICLLDVDGDGFLAARSPVISLDADCDDDGEALSGAADGDCDDNDGDVYPGGPEVVGDEVDGNCNGEEICFEDEDDDGFLSELADTRASADLDCDDAREGGAADPTTDCDDLDPRAFPGAVEIAGDGVDQSCDGAESCFDDDDDDGFLDTTGDRRASADVDCDDEFEGTAFDPTTDCDDRAATVHPGASEVVGDSVDQTCDGRERCFVDADDDGFLDTSGQSRISPDTDCLDPFEGTSTDPTSDCDDQDPQSRPGAPEVVGDGVDQDCDGGERCADDPDDDGFLAPTPVVRISTDPDCDDPQEGLAADPRTDCDDAVASTFPGAPEVVGDEVDQDCDGQELCFDDDDDDGFLDATGDTRSSTDADCDDDHEGLASDPITDCDDSRADIFPGAPDGVGDGVDQDCSGEETCLDDDDNDGFLDASGDTRPSADADCDDANEGETTDPTTDCDDALASVYPGAPEVTGDGVDQDCDGQEICFDDDDDDGYLDNTGDVRVSVDADCADANEGRRGAPITDCNDQVASINPGAPELPGDEIDQTCDRRERCFDDDDNDGFLDPSGDVRTSLDLDCDDAHEGLASDPTTDCDDVDPAVRPGVPELSGDGVDQNCDGVESCLHDDDDDGFLDAAGDLVLSTDADCADPFEGTVSDPTTDCDDDEPRAWPGGTEVAGDEVDGDCDGSERCLEDDDDDGFLDRTGDAVVSTDLSCAGPHEGRATDPLTDCDDSRADVFPGAGEEAGDGVDQDCDGGDLCYQDDDADGQIDGSGDVVGSDDLDCADPGEAPADALQTDCDDGDPTVYAGATEVPGDGVDQDCDGGETCYEDADDDGFLGRTGRTILSADLDCADAFEGPRSGPFTDCDDAAAAVFPGATELPGDEVDQNCNGRERCWHDDDDDGFLDGEGDVVQSDDLDCDDPEEGLAGDPTTDCDDRDARARPGGTEVVGDQIDGDCDGRERCFEDDDRDGFLDGEGDEVLSSDLDCADPGEAPLGAPTTDCDDQDGLSWPGASELVGSGRDEDCDGAETCLDDRDDDGFLDPVYGPRASADADCDDPYEAVLGAPATDCDDLAADVYPGAPEVTADGVDQDCDGGELCYVDVDGDGWRLDAVAVSTNADCTGLGEAAAWVPAGDCDDGDDSRFPGATERPGDGEDSDCDGLELCWLDGDGDGQPPSLVVTQPSVDVACAADGLTATALLDCDDGDAGVYRGAVELPVSGVDEDCDGLEACWADADRDGWRTDVLVLAADLSCRAAGLADASVPAGDCDDAAAAVNPGQVEDPDNGVDDDCASGVSCGQDLDGDGAILGSLPSVDDDCDDAGEAAPGAPGDCDDADPLRHPAASEIAGDGVDQDCRDGELCLADADADGFVRAGARTVVSADEDCADPGEALSAAPDGDCDDNNGAAWPGAPEVVADGVDQDCDRGDLCWVDGDGDGYLLAGRTVLSADRDCLDVGEGTTEEAARSPDCDDARAAVHPDAVEVAGADGDLDCDGVVACWVDADQDGERSASTALSADADCADPGEARAAALLDCDDADAAVRHGVAEQVGDGVDQDCDGAELCLEDADNDGFVTGLTRVSRNLACDGPGEAPAGTPGGDCDDAEATTFPGAEERVGDEVDQDCDRGERCYQDGDGDAWHAGVVIDSADVDCTDAGEALVFAQPGDCDDGDGRVHPLAPEAVADGVDSDCDGLDLCWVDADGDGQRADAAPVLGADCGAAGLTTGVLVDCDDGDAAVYRGAAEQVGDGVDSDCDGAELCVLDADQDRFGGPEITPSTDLSCSRSGTLADRSAGLDCDDSRRDIHPGADDPPGTGVEEDCVAGVVCAVDADGDGFVLAGAVVDSADEDCADPGEAMGGLPDCDDGRADVFGGAAEIVGDEVDGDCDGGELCRADADGDGWRTEVVLRSPDVACDGPGEAAASAPGGDCDDERAEVFPGAAEVPADGRDADCDSLELCWTDGDGDGQTGDAGLLVAGALDCAGLVRSAAPLDCDDGDAGVYVGAPDPVGDGIDQDCDGSEACHPDRDGDGHGTTEVVVDSGLCQGPGLAAPGAPLDDCDDSDARVVPGAEEGVADGVDSDCDGLELCRVDADEDGQAGPLLAPGPLRCEAAGVTSGPVQDCADDDAAVFVGAVERPGDARDQDCDGLESCYLDDDRDGFRVATTVSTVEIACAAPGLALAAVPGPDCDDADPAIYPGAPDDPLDGVDQDCDQALTCLGDFDQDGFADPTAILLVSDGDCADPGEQPLGGVADCDDGDATVSPAAAESPADFTDSDCDGQELCWVDFDGDGWRIDAVVPSFDLTCDQPGEAGADLPAGDCEDGDAAVSPDTREVVADGVDQDCDGLELCFVDVDGDGWRTAETVESSDPGCAGPGEADAEAPAGDCADGDPTRFLGAEEGVGDEIDQDCDGRERCHVDADEDGYRAERGERRSDDADCADPGEASLLAGVDCDDEAAGVNPGAYDAPGDGVDQDCSEGARPFPCLVDRDGDGVSTGEALESVDADCEDEGEIDEGAPVGDCDDRDAGVSPGAVEGVDDGVDQDCDGEELCFADGDGDGWRTALTVASPDLDCGGAGEAGSGVPDGDCADDDAAVHPGADEGPADEVDQDCDGLELCFVDGDSDGLRPDATSTLVSADVDCLDAGEATAGKVVGDCDDSSADADGDGLDDAREVLQLQTDPCASDSDGDGLSDEDEVNQHATDPLDADTDGGGVGDGEEVLAKKDPLNPGDDLGEDKVGGCGCAGAAGPWWLGVALWWGRRRGALRRGERAPR